MLFKFCIGYFPEGKDLCNPTELLTGRPTRQLKIAICLEVYLDHRLTRISAVSN